MKLFSDINDNNLNEENIEDLYNGYLTIKSYNDYEFVDEKDCVGILPYLVDYNEILIRKEIVPSYQYTIPEQNYFLTIVSGTIEENEEPEDTLFREMEEETGIRINNNYNGYEKWGEYFICKSNSSKYYLYYLPLYQNDFQKIRAKGDGSEIEKHSSTVRVDKKYLKTLKPSDLVSALMLSYFDNKL